MSEDATKEILDLRKQIDSYKAEIDSIKSDAPADTSSLSQGSDIYALEYTVRAEYEYINSPFDLDFDHPARHFRQTADFAWNDIFYAISPLLIDEAAEKDISDKLDSFIWHSRKDDIDSLVEGVNYSISSVSIVDTYFQTIKIQLRALGLIIQSVKKRSIHSKDSYWTLTPYGDTVMTRLRAIKK
ncbi:hypothetical protein [Spirosoma jeollabukense]